MVLWLITLHFIPEIDLIEYIGRKLFCNVSNHQHRKETNCLNCDATVLGNYCQKCGQENVEPKQTLWHLIIHFFNDVTHFDGKFFSTLKLLLFKPGFLSTEYIKGRRIKYLDPIRMYLFISALFLITFNTFNHKEKYVSLLHDKELIAATDSIRALEPNVKDNNKETGFSYSSYMVEGKKVGVFTFPRSWMQSREQYDSVQATLPGSQRDGYLKRFVVHSGIAMNKAYEEDPYNFTPAAVNGFYHSFSKIFFISLPLFALWLYLLYFRRRKQYYFVSHAIFSIHIYCVAFIFLTVSFLPFLADNWPDEVNTAVAVGLLLYLYVAMLRFYKQGWFKTFLKFLILTFVMCNILLVVVIGLLLNSFLHAGVH